MNDIVFIRENGNVPKSLPGEDHISALMTYMADADLPSGYGTTNRIKSYATLESAEADGITDDTSNAWEVQALHYHISEFFRMNPSGILYVGIFVTPATSYDYAEIKEIKNYAEGRVRQIAIYNPAVDFAATEITAVKAILDLCYTEHAPMVALLACNISSISGLTDPSATGQERIGVIAGQDGGAKAAALGADTDAVGSLTCIGLALGALSKAAVNESICWVQKFPAGIDAPALADGSLVNETDASVLDTLNANRFIFLRKHIGIAGSYFNDSHNMDVATSDYAYLESVRTMDKAERGIRKYILPYLGSPLYVDPNTGKLRQDTVSFLETTAGKAMEDMEKDGELSGYSVAVDPEQNVLSSSEVEFVVKNVATGVMRKVKMRTSYATSV